MASKRCIRCETLERKQRSKQIIYSGPDGSIPLCAVCVEEIAEMDILFKKLEVEEEEDEFGGEGYNS